MRTTGTAVLGGLVLGLGTFLTQATAWGWTTNAVATWSALAFLVGCTGKPSWRVAGAAVGSLLLALVVWYGVAQAVHGWYSASAWSTAAVWAAGAVIAGIVFGFGAAWWRQRPGTWLGAAGLALLVALFAVDGLYRLVILRYPGQGVTMLVVALVLLVVLGRRSWRPAVATLPLVVLGAGGYALLGFALGASA
ncbi:DUF6518 family protein [Amycolatopsis sp. NPDC051903]|uniref:DUF6518 family protein n=1 Tax=Amycolatopsis sp. NPDC051903 TaxID=3363936 RepID=UPI00378E9EC4